MLPRISQTTEAAESKAGKNYVVANGYEIRNYRHNRTKGKTREGQALVRKMAVALSAGNTMVVKPSIKVRMYARKHARTHACTFISTYVQAKLTACVYLNTAVLVKPKTCVYQTKDLCLLNTKSVFGLLKRVYFQLS